MSRQSRINFNQNVRFPKKDTGRSTLFIDESGVASLNDSRRYYILTGVMAKNSMFHNLTSYYILLKRKYFGTAHIFHANEIFSPTFGGRQSKGSRKKLFRIARYKDNFAEEIALLIDSLPFAFKTVIIDKKSLLDNSSRINIKAPDKATFKKAYSVWQSRYPQNNYSDFERLSVKEVLNIVKSLTVPNIPSHYPLEVALKDLLNTYFTEYWKLAMDNGPAGGICIENSSDVPRIMKYFNAFLDDKDENNDRTPLAKGMRLKIIDISFPNKHAKYPGLEIADIISYGFHLKMNRRLSKTEAYAPIWKVIQKRMKEYESYKQYNSVSIVK
jgi:hypothetical protein